MKKRTKSDSRFMWKPKRINDFIGLIGLGAALLAVSISSAYSERGMENTVNAESRLGAAYLGAKIPVWYRLS